MSRTTASTLRSTLSYEWQALNDWATLEADWLALYSQSAPNVFLSWPWIETWIKTYERVVRVLRVFHDGKLVAMGFWAHQYHARPFRLNVRTLHLHHCGIEALDQIWPEYNELLCLPAYRDAVHGALLQNLPQDLNITEVDMGVCERQLSHTLIRQDRAVSNVEPVAAGIFTSSKWLREERWSSVAIQVNLNQWADVDAYVASLSSSFRYQLRRAEKGLKKLGSLSLVFANSAHQCEQWLMADAHWHQQQWGRHSGFNNPAFVKFHKAWIAKAFDRSLCGYVRLLAGTEVTAGAYFFQDASRIYFYLGFARNDWGPKVKAGFCLHLAMIRHCYEQGIPMYDFMGGDYDYKRRFGKTGPLLVRCRYKPPTLLNRAEQLMKLSKMKWQLWQKRAKPS